MSQSILGKLGIGYFALLLVAIQGCALGKPDMSDSLAHDGSFDGIMNCTDHATAQSGNFWIENNTWGKNTFEDWFQCVGIKDRGLGKIAARWTWNWPDSYGGVRAYPEVIFGQKPGKKTSIGTLPRNVNDIQAATVSLDYESYHTGAGNLSFDIWLVDTDNPVEFAVPPITHEIMIWLDSYGNMQSTGESKGNVTIDGIDYEIFVGEKVGKGWRYIAFKRASRQSGNVRLDLKSFFSYLKASNLIAGNEFVASVELGNEIVRGAGETRINSYSAVIR